MQSHMEIRVREQRASESLGRGVCVGGCVGGHGQVKGIVR